MKVMTFDRNTGFGEVEFPVEWNEGENFESWLKRAGFEVSADAEDVLESTNGVGFGLKVFPAVAQQAHGYAALVSLDDVNRWDHVLCPTRADLWELRLKMMPFHQLELMQQLDRFVEMQRKYFFKDHQHSADVACDICDPTAAKAQREDRERLRRHRAERAKNPAG